MIQRIALAGMLMMGLELIAPAPLQAEPEEFWLCTQQGGKETYTNRKEASSRPAEPVPAVNEYPGSPGIDRHDPPTRRLPGEISFETYRMLSTGTTEAEILTRAGQPRYTFRIALGTWVWVYLNDEWLVEVTFSGGRVANISRYLPKP